MMQLLAATEPHVDPWLYTFVRHAPLSIRMAVAFTIGVAVSRVLIHWFPRMGLPESIWADPDYRRVRASLRSRLPLVGIFFTDCWTSRERARRAGTWAVELATGLLYAGLVFAVIDIKVQEVPYEGSGFYIHWRLCFQFLLLALIIAATTIDLELYLIPDYITLTGAIAGVGLATAFGHFQMVPLWVDCSYAQLGLSGAYIPEWIKHHEHWHGIAWSSAGLVTGAGLTWIVRTVASFVLGQEALGFGDVTLMGMIGAFMGWQPIVFVFMLAPLCGIVVGIAVRLFTGRTYVPYGPYLSFAAVAVLYSWKWLWEPTRMIFGDWLLLLALGAASLVGLVILLGLSRLYWMIPVQRPQRTPPSVPPANIENDVAPFIDEQQFSEPEVAEEEAANIDAAESEP